MHRSETDELVHCLDCGEEISLTLDRAFAVEDDAGVCFTCALKRGGVYDEAHDTWTHAPKFADLRPRE